MNDNGNAPVEIRLSHKGTRRFITTDLRVEPDKWRDDEVTRSHAKSATINAALRQKESTLQDVVVQLQASRRTTTADRFKNAAVEALSDDSEPEDPAGFAQFCEDRIQRMYDNGATRRAHMNGVVKLRKFLKQRRGVDDIPLTPSTVTATLLEEMMAWESEERGNATNTIHKTMRTLRRMINVAIRDGLFPRSEYPFDHLTLKRERTEKTPLTASQVRSLEALQDQIDAGESDFDREGLAAHSLRAFLFAIYMLGMRWSDVATLEWSQLRNGRIGYQMWKTGAQKDLKIVPPAAKILEQYDQREGESRWVFPFVERYAHKFDLSTEEGVREAIIGTNRRVNQELKKIDEAAEIGLGLTTHIARHTSAQRMMEQGWTLQEINAALAHESLETTEKYLRSVRDEELDDKHEDLW